MTQILIDGTLVDAPERCAIRWYASSEGCKPSLYLDGKRVTKPWSVKMDVEEEADVLSEGSVNTV